MKQRIQQEMGLGVEDGSEVVCLRCSKEFMFFQRRRELGIDDWMNIRYSTKKVEIQDMETDEIIIYSAMYKAAKRFSQQSRLISAYDGKVWRNRYAIKVLTEYECF